MRVLITGGTGFIGSHLARRLIDTSEVHVLARPASKLCRIEDIVSKVTVWQGDTTDFEAINRCVQGVQPHLVFHLAGDTSGRRWSHEFSELDTSIEVNLRGTLNVVHALNALPRAPLRMIRAGGLAEYGDAPVPFDESRREEPVSAYGASQAATTTILSAVSRQLRFPVITLRLAAVYGPGRNEDFFLPSLIVHCLEGGEFEMTSGDQPWDLIYIDDAVSALTLAAEKPLDPGEIINIGSGNPRTLRQIAEIAFRKIGGRAKLRIGAMPVTAGDIRSLYCRTEKAKRLLGWEARTDLDSGLDRTIAWYRERLGKPT
jgi:nucleoside-diphosphate-sugar epimerase